MANHGRFEQPTLNEVMNYDFTVSPHPLSEHTSPAAEARSFSFRTRSISPQRPQDHSLQPSGTVSPLSGYHQPYAYPNETDLAHEPVMKLDSRSHIHSVRGDTEKDTQMQHGPGHLEPPFEQSSSSFSKPLLPDFKHSSWTVEVCGLLLAAVSWASAAGVLAYYDGKPMADGPHGITLATLIALLNTIVYASLAVALAGGLSQLKWIHFQTRRAPLQDMEVFDEASRGPLGSLKLIYKRRGGVFGTLGALLFVLALAVAPFTQQIWTYEGAGTASTGAITVPAATGYSDNIPSDSSSNGYLPSAQMTAAIYSGIFAQSSSLYTPSFSCPTGQCSWGAFNTLGLCAQCESLQASTISTYCPPGDSDLSTCGWQATNGAKLNYSSHLFSMTPTFPSLSNVSYELMSLAFIGRSPPMARSEAEIDPWAQTCTLSVCVQNVQDRVKHGEFSENILQVDSPSNSSTGYQMEPSAALGIQTLLSQLFFTGFATADNASDASPLSANVTAGSFSGKTYFSSRTLQSFFTTYYSDIGTDGLLVRLNTLADAMSSAIRTPSTDGFASASPIDYINGSATSSSSPLISVRWAWMALPVIVLAGTIIWLAVIAIASRSLGVRLFKSSALAMVFAGFETRADDIVDKLRARQADRKERSRTTKRRAMQDSQSGVTTGAHTPRVITMTAIREHANDHDGTDGSASTDSVNHTMDLGLGAGDREARMDPSSVQEKLDEQEELNALRSQQKRRPYGPSGAATTGLSTALGTGYTSVMSGSTAFSGTESARPLFSPAGGTRSPMGAATPSASGFTARGPYAGDSHRGLMDLKSVLDAGPPGPPPGRGNAGNDGPGPSGVTARLVRDRAVEQAQVPPMQLQILKSDGRVGARHEENDDDDDDRKGLLRIGGRVIRIVS